MYGSGHLGPYSPLGLKSDHCPAERQDMRTSSTALAAITILAILWGFSNRAYSTTYVEVEPTDDLTAIIEGAANDTVITLTAGTFNLGVNTPHDQGILIKDKTNLTITGQGWDNTIIKLPSSAQFGFYTGSNVDNLKIDKMQIEGTTPLTNNTHGIGNFTGSTNISDVTFSELRLKDTAVGISIATSGDLNGVTISNNVISNTIGLEAGWGYGIHMENARNALIADNLIQNATRHSVYLAGSAPGSNVTIARNTILNHDPNGQQRAVTGRWYVAALAVARSSDVDVAFNNIVNSRTIALSVEPNGATTDINLLGNEIIDAWYVGLWVTTDQTHTAMGNTFTHFPNPDADGNGWNDEISFFNWPVGVPTSSALEPPDPRWATIDYIDEMGDNKVYVMKDGVLDKITDPYETWAYDTCPTVWPGAESMTAVADAAGADQGRLCLLENGILYEVNPDTWEVSIPGDVTGDGWVGGDDLTVILTHWGLSGMSRQQGDLTGDGFIGGDDYSEVLTYWGTGNPMEPLLASVPEPASAVMLGLLVPPLLARRRKA